jgi:hypothetical protein
MVIWDMSARKEGMMIRRYIFGICVFAGIWQASIARAGFDFFTNSTATQTITSPLFGNVPFSITAQGPQHFVIDPATGSASVTSNFQGTDLPNPGVPGSFFSYNLFNTATTGTVTPAGVGPYTVTFSLLFELDITSGPFAGLELETTQNAIFQASNIAGFPFVAGTTFGDPNRPADGVTIFVKVDPTNTLAAGTTFGTSSDRVVTIISAVPEPTSMALCALGAGIAVSLSRARGRRRSAKQI